MTFRYVLCLLGSGLALNSPAWSQSLLERVTLEQAASILKESGYRAEIVGDKKKAIRTGIGGRTVLVTLYGCGDSGCSSLQFYAGFRKTPKFSLEYANDWNSRKRFAKAYIENNGGLAFELDVDLDGGVGEKYIKEKIILFEKLLSELEKFDGTR